MAAAKKPEERCAEAAERLLNEATEGSVNQPRDDLKLRAAGLFLQLAQFHQGGTE